MAGFYGKYFIFLALLEAEMYLLAIFAALYVAVAAYYYIRIVKVMFLVEEAPQPATLVLSRGVKLALIASGVLTVGIGLYPEPFLAPRVRLHLAGAVVIFSARRAERDTREPPSPD